MLCCELIACKVEYNAAILHSCGQTCDVWHSGNILVVYQCLLLGTEVFFIYFAVKVTKCYATKILCTFLFFPLCQRWKVIFKCACCLWLHHSCIHSLYMLIKGQYNNCLR